MNKKIFSLLFSALLFTSLSLTITTASVNSVNEDVTIYVDDDNTEGPWDGTIDYPYQHIKDAILASSNGTNIFVFSGIYDESLLINKNVNIIGENKSDTIIIGLIIIFDTEWTKLSHLTITKNSNEDEITTGISIFNCQNTLITHSQITDHDVGLLISEDTSNSIIKQNSITNNDIGIDICNSTNNLIYGNNIQQNLNTNIILFHSKDNVITQNIIRDASNNLQFHTSKDIITKNYWGNAKQIQFFIGYYTIQPLQLTIPWIKVLFHPLTDITQQEINSLAKMDTTLGSMIIELYGEKLPLTTQNFIDLANIDFFDGLVFHRVIDDFVIQGGGYDVNGKHKESPLGSIPLETHLDVTHVDGAISMARTNDPDSATSQFFICDGAQHGLDGNYAAFGKVLTGFDTLHLISSVETTTKHFMQDWPVEEVIIHDISIV